MQIDTAFHKHLRSALNHLYDRDILRHSPLAVDLRIADRIDLPSALQKVLADAINALKPPADEPLSSKSRQLYDVLLYRYIQQFEQDHVANQLGVSERHLRRLQAEALDALACHLWEMYHPPAGTTPAVEATQGARADDDGAADDAARDGETGEWNWLRDAPAERLTNSRQAILGILELARPLATQHRVELAESVGDEVPSLSVHPVALRQIILNLVSVAIHRAPGGTVSLAASTQREMVELQVRASPSAAAGQLAEFNQEASLVAIAGRLALLSGGTWQVKSTEALFLGTLTLPKAGSVAVLAVDDNDDIIRLLERYTSGTRYAVIGSSEPDRIFELIADNDARLVVLDVMMPKVDGWELLGRLRRHPRTAHIPIIMLSVLAQEELALSLGAAALILKPITQAAFLAALDRVCAIPAPESP